MARNTVHVDASPEDVFDVLDDHRCYSEWVVGTARIRGADDDWPAEGSALYHQVGTKDDDASIKDKSTVLERDRPRKLVLDALARPAGVARVTLTVEPDAGGSKVTIDEYPIKPDWAHKLRLVLDPLIFARNLEAMRRFKRLVERRAAASRST